MDGSLGGSEEKPSTEGEGYRNGRTNRPLLLPSPPPEVHMELQQTLVNLGRKWLCCVVLFHFLFFLPPVPFSFYSSGQ